ncbi:MAG: RluA family pseudouridine synthase [Chloroflexi bacterium]|nr:RluA family pseudouridine synthase [Chloroflexota bacterium]
MSAPPDHAFTVAPTTAGGRLDQAVVAALGDLTRAHVQRLIERGLVTVNGASAKAGHKLRAGDQVAVRVPPPVPTTLRPQPLPLAVVYEDAAVLVIDKPAGLVVHPAPGHPDGTLANAILAHAPEVAMNGSQRPGIVHRLDKDTSGLLVVARTDAARQALVAQFAAREVLKEYVALVVGHPPDTATVDAPIGRDPRRRQRMAVVSGGRPARTEVAVLERLPGHALVRARIATGRTHQIRVHLAALGHPVVGDAVYGHGGALVLPPGANRPLRRVAVPRQFLHAARLAFRLPDSGAWRAFDSPLPPDLTAVLDALRGTGDGE